VAAEEAGVAADRIHWLHGLVHYQQAKFDDAIREFESTIKLKPSVAAYAMLHHALLLSGNFPALQQRVSEYNQLDSMKPETAEDYLCRGFALGFGNKDQGLADLDRAIAMRDTPMAHAFRAGVETVHASYEGNPALAKRALDDVVEAKLRLSDSKF